MGISRTVTIASHPPGISEGVREIITLATFEEIGIEMSGLFYVGHRRYYDEVGGF